MFLCPTTSLLLGRLEKIKIRSLRSQAKLFGTLATVAGAMVMTLLKGPVLEILGSHGSNNHNQNSGGANIQHVIKGSVMITIGCFSWAGFMILQVSYFSIMNVKNISPKFLWIPYTASFISVSLGHYPWKLPCGALPYIMDMPFGNSWRRHSSPGYGKRQPFSMVSALGYKAAGCCL